MLARDGVDEAQCFGMKALAVEAGDAVVRTIDRVPCHRVVGSSGSLTGYAGGLDKKIALLKLERADSAKGTNFINIPGVHRVGCCV